MARPAALAHGGKFPLLYIRRKLARKCHNNSEKKKEGVGKERGSSVGSSLHCKYFDDFNS
jgi:hypothetical protein